MIFVCTVLVNKVNLCTKTDNSGGCGLDKVITVENLSLTIKKHVILTDVNLQVEKGTIHGLIGRNGSGKTVLMKCICGFYKPTSGIVKVNGRIVGSEVDFPDNLGVIIETPGFIPHYSGYRNLRFLANLSGKADNDAIKRSMQTVGLDPKLKLSVRKYSLGMRQRLGLAQAIMEAPEILVLDEPFNGLDRDGVSDMRRYLLNLKEQGKTILISSHSAEDISILCDSVNEMDKVMLIQE